MAKTIKALKGKAVRVLRDLKIDGTRYKAGQVVAFTPAQAEALRKDGSADPHPDAVGYALAQGEQAVQHNVVDQDEGSQDPAPTPAPTPAPSPDPTPAPTTAPDSGIRTSDSE